MDKLLRDTVLAGFSDKQIAEIIGLELRRRGMIGVLYFFPSAGGSGTFAACAPSTLIDPDMSASDQLTVFAACASCSLGEKQVSPDDLDKQWAQ